jgi:superfamily II DNA or RNA helicase
MKDMIIPRRPSLFPDQVETIRKIHQEYLSGTLRTILYAPTGAGKTVIASDLIADLIDGGMRVIFIVNKYDLIGQTIERFREHFGFTPAGLHRHFNRNPGNPFQVTTIQTLNARDIRPAADFIVLDEAHGSVSPSYVKILEYYPDTPILGLSATPFRTKSDEGLGDYYESIVMGPQIYELIEIGRLVPINHYLWQSGLNINLKGIKTVNGDYEKQGLQDAVDRPEVVIKMVDEWERLAHERRTITFAVSIAHATNIMNEVNRRGYHAKVVTGETPPDERTDMYRELKHQDINMVVSVGVLTEGFDEPAVECVFHARPTKSHRLYLQSVGRGLRVSPDTGKTDCLLLDFASNFERFGAVDDHLDVDLHKGVVQAQAKQKSTFKHCPHCHFLVRQNIAVCPRCSHEFIHIKPETTGIVPDGSMVLVTETNAVMTSSITGDLREYIRTMSAYKVPDAKEYIIHTQFKGSFRCIASVGITRNRELDITFSDEFRANADSFAARVVIDRIWYIVYSRYAYHNDYSPGFAYMKLKEASGIMTEKYANLLAQGAVFGPNPTPRNRRDYYEYLVRVARAKGKNPAMINSSYFAEFRSWPKSDGLIQKPDMESQGMVLDSVS